MGKVIAVSNQKGGVGKTTTAINLSSTLALLNKKVLLIDIDPQGNTTRGLGFDRSLIIKSVYHTLIYEYSLKEIQLETSIENLKLIPATYELAGVDLELSNIGDDKHFRLKKVIDKIKHEFDFIIIDCPPSLGLLNANALTSCDSVLIPVQCEYYAMEGLAQLWSTIRKIQQTLNNNLKVEGILLTMFDSRTKYSLEILDEVKSFFKEKVYTTIIPRNVKLSEASFVGKSIMEYDSKSRGAITYNMLAKEVIANGEKESR